MICILLLFPSMHWKMFISFWLCWLVKAGGNLLLLITRPGIWKLSYFRSFPLLPSASPALNPSNWRCFSFPSNLLSLINMKSCECLWNKSVFFKPKQTNSMLCNAQVSTGRKFDVPSAVRIWVSFIRCRLIIHELLFLLSTRSCFWRWTEADRKAFLHKLSVNRIHGARQWTTGLIQKQTTIDSNCRHHFVHHCIYVKTGLLTFLQSRESREELFLFSEQLTRFSFLLFSVNRVFLWVFLFTLAK